MLKGISPRIRCDAQLILPPPRHEPNLRQALVRGVAQCGGGKWADIKKLGFTAIEHRTAVDLKDKWRNLLRIAMLPQQSVKTVGDKKREIPQELLAKVRELAAKQAKAKAAAESRR